MFGYDSWLLDVLVGLWNRYVLHDQLEEGR